MIAIRKATVDDAGAIGVLIRASAEAHILPSLTGEGRAHFLDDHTDASIAERLRRDFDYHVAERGGELVGVVGVRLPTHLYHLFVVDAARQRGIGRRLWQHAWRAAGSPGTMTVNASLNAVDAYRRFGFVEDGGPMDVGGVVFQPMTWRVISCGDARNT